jgi:hypothetical protein
MVKQRLAAHTQEQRKSVGSGRLTRRQLDNLKTAERETDRVRALIPVVQGDFPPI